jgi:hypothetical protein
MDGGKEVRGEMTSRRGLKYRRVFWIDGNCR